MCLFDKLSSLRACAGSIAPLCSRYSVVDRAHGRRGKSSTGYPDDSRRDGPIVRDVTLDGGKCCRSTGCCRDLVERQPRSAHPADRPAAGGVSGRPPGGATGSVSGVTGLGASPQHSNPAGSFLFVVRWDARSGPPTPSALPPLTPLDVSYVAAHTTIQTTTALTLGFASACRLPAREAAYCQICANVGTSPIVDTTKLV
ncbi:hypothetical protein EVAR_18496_1 [Eumeta japonica]|uniref:Uncharacterized protein n=1 Tax=Eumeta variegata TaxID=151549 RepID=A0A4C1V113_EUMVA|nr:hypothetical protein EVAR_18496_1 [Eumeta japonica]